MARKFSATVATSRTGTSSERRSSDEDQQDDARTTGTITVRSRRGLLGVVLLGGVAADQRVAHPAPRARRSRSRGDGPLGGVAVRGGVSAWRRAARGRRRRGAPVAGPAARAVDRYAAATPSVPSAASATSAARSASAMTTAGLPEPPGKCRPSVCCAATDGASLTKISSSGTPLDDRRGRRRRPADQQRWSSPHAARRPVDQRGDRRHMPVPPGCRAAGLGAAGQYAVAAQQDQDGRQEGQRARARRRRCRWRRPARAPGCSSGRSRAGRAGPGPRSPRWRRSRPATGARRPHRGAAPGRPGAASSSRKRAASSSA